MFIPETESSGHVLRTRPVGSHFLQSSLWPRVTTSPCNCPQPMQLPHAEMKDRHAAAHLAHEVRSLVSATLGALQLVAKGAVPLQRDYWLEVLEAQSKALLALVDSMLVGGRLRASEQVTRSSVEVSTLVRTSAFELEVLALQKGLKLEVHVSSRVEGLTLTTDGTAVSQIVRNLLANAIKFTTMGSIHLTADVKDEWIEISVVDTGSGMIPSLAANLFRPYSGTGAAESGCGLGLWISAELARSLGGKLEVESTQSVEVCLNRFDNLVEY